MQELLALFKPVGATFVRLHTDKVTGRPKGFAHVHFPDGPALDRWADVWGLKTLNPGTLNGPALDRRADV